MTNIDHTDGKNFKQWMVRDIQTIFLASFISLFCITGIIYATINAGTFYEVEDWWIPYVFILIPAAALFTFLKWYVAIIWIFLFFILIYFGGWYGFTMAFLGEIFTVYWYRTYKGYKNLQKGISE